ncbi:MAG: DNA repair protein [Myxococcales bacterium]|nr:DNA repair protein [Myxococcales bacterium]|tara:strand:+ start:1619 stop:2191 length:573 start_codon:yes stop_codon:yes gene_type:complete
MKDELFGAYESKEIYSLGHSNRRFDEFLQLLVSADIRTLVDVRSVPYSRRYPWFIGRRMERQLLEEGIRYVHKESLGGKRPDTEPHPETAGVAEGFRSYVLHMRSDEFQKGLYELMFLARTEGPVAYLCAEREPTDCHRQFLSDALVQAGFRVRHLINSDTLRDHQLHPAAQSRPDGLIGYPAPQEGLPL